MAIEYFANNIGTIFLVFSATLLPFFLWSVFKEAVELSRALFVVWAISALLTALALVLRIPVHV